MANRFETPVASEFINTYVPIPFREMMLAGQMKQQRYDAGVAAQDAAIQRVEQIQAIAGSADDDYRRLAIQKMYDIRDKYVGKDLSDPFILRQMNNEINTGIEKEWIQKMQESKGSWDEAQKAKRTLAMNNKWNPLLDKDPSSGWNSKEMGQYNYQPTAFVDKTELFNPYYKDLNAESSIQDVNGYQSVVTGISDAKVRAVSDTRAQELVNTPQGQQQIELYRMANPESKKADLQILKDEMYDYGKQFVSSNIQVLSDKLQRSGGDGSTKTPAYFNMTNTKGGVVENYKNEREAQNKITELKASNDPVSIRKAADMEQVIVEAQARRDTDFSNQTNPILMAGVDKLVSSGAFATRAEAYSYMQPFLQDKNEGAKVARNQTLKGVPDWVGNQLLAVVRGNKELFDMAGSGIAAVATKGFNAVAGEDHKTLGDLYTDYKEGADANDSKGLFGQGRKNTKQEAIVWDTMKKLASAIKSNEVNYSNDLKDSLSKTTQDTYMVNIPSKAQESLAWNLNTDSTPAGLSSMGNMAEDITIRPEDYIITEVDGKPITDSKLSQKAAKTFSQRGYQVERISPVLNSSSKNGYLPTVEFIYKSEKSTDEGTDGYRRRIKVNLKPEQAGSLVENLYRVGANEAAHIISRASLAQQVDTDDYSSGKNYQMMVPGSATPENVRIQGAGNRFTVTYQGENGPVEEIATNRVQLKNLLFSLELNNRSEETGEPALFQF